MSTQFSVDDVLITIATAGHVRIKGPVVTTHSHGLIDPLLKFVFWWILDIWRINLIQ